jgi:hypothetical protein
VVAGLNADVHQARHWYVTAAVRAIYEHHGGDGSEVRRRLRELIEYMRWRSGWNTLEAYEHYFDAGRHAGVQEQVHAKLEAALRRTLKRNAPVRRVRPARSGIEDRDRDVSEPRPVDELALLEDLLR